MGTAEDIASLETMINSLITRYDQYFIGLEKREPLQLRAEVDAMVRRYSGIPITNTMQKHKYAMLVARLCSYREQWNRILRLIDEGKYSRDQVFGAMNRYKKRHGTDADRPETEGKTEWRQNELEQLCRDYLEARNACNLPVDNVSSEMVAACIKRQRPALSARLGNDNISFRVVIEDGKPKIKAKARK
jgi:hypothetical protein